MIQNNTHSNTEYFNLAVVEFKFFQRNCYMGHNHFIYLSLEFYAS